LSYSRKWNSAFDKNLFRPMTPSSTTPLQAASERQFAVAPLTLARWRLPPEGKGHTFRIVSGATNFIVLQSDARAQTETVGPSNSRE
jgi:hypothetical protein